MTSNDGGTAFPIVEPGHVRPIVILGMSKREFVAAQALPAVVASYSHQYGASPSYDNAARDAIGYADALLRNLQEMPCKS